MVPDAPHGETARSRLTAMNCAERVAEHVDGETVAAAGLFQRRDTPTTKTSSTGSATGWPKTVADDR
jgi:hypothetical protein